MTGILLAICCVLTAYSVYLESKITVVKKSTQYLYEEVDKIIDKCNELIMHVNNMSDRLLALERRINNDKITGSRKTTR